MWIFTCHFLKYEGIKKKEEERIRVTDGTGRGGRTHKPAANDVYEVGLISKFHLQLCRIQARLSVMYTWCHTVK